MSYGGAHISTLYGKVVCSSVLPSASEFVARTPLLVETVEGLFLVGDDVRIKLGDIEPNIVGSLDHPMCRGHLYSDAPTASTLTVSSADGSELIAWRWNGKSYERTIGSITVTASAVVVLHTSESTGCPPDGILRDMLGLAVAAADGRMIAPRWVRYPGWYAGLVLEDWSSTRGLTVRLPPGRSLFEVVNERCAHSYRD